MLNWFARKVSGTDRPDTIALDLRGCWEVDATVDASAFLRAVPLIAGPKAVLYVEGTGEQHVTGKISQLAIPAQANLARGTIWPRQDIHHISAAVNVMNELASFLDDNPAGRVFAHCHLYESSVVLLQWHDAFSDPMYIARDVARENVARFAEALGVTWRQNAG